MNNRKGMLIVAGVLAAVLLIAFQAGAQMGRAGVLRLAIMEALAKPFAV